MLASIRRVALSMLEQWEAIVADQPPDWSHMSLQLRLRDANESEETAVVLSPLNPWHGNDWRSGSFRFRVAKSWGYGAGATLVRRKMMTLDEVGIRGQLDLLRGLSDVKPVGTQGPLL
jgi:hypothetical protein